MMKTPYGNIRSRQTRRPIRRPGADHRFWSHWQFDDERIPEGSSVASTENKWNYKYNLTG